VNVEDVSPYALVVLTLIREGLIPSASYGIRARRACEMGRINPE
jgi:hypothetical protein